MTHDAKELLERALKLPRELRADLATRLFESLEKEDAVPAEVEKAWRDEIVKRLRRALESGESGVPLEQVSIEARAFLETTRSNR